MARTAKNRRIAMLLLVVMVFILACSALFLTHQSAHICAGKGCPVCLHISIVRELLGKLGCVCMAVFAILALCGGFASFEDGFARSRRAITLVSLNVKLLD